VPTPTARTTSHHLCELPRHHRYGTQDLGSARPRRERRPSKYYLRGQPMFETPRTTTLQLAQPHHRGGVGNQERLGVTTTSTRSYSLKKGGPVLKFMLAAQRKPI